MMMDAGGKVDTHGLTVDNQTLAAFLVVRPPIAYLGWGWESDDGKWLRDTVTGYEPFFLQPGEPIGLCKTEGGGVFSRQFKNGKAALDCSDWTSSLPFPSLQPMETHTTPLKADDYEEQTTIIDVDVANVTNPHVSTNIRGCHADLGFSSLPTFFSANMVCKSTTNPLSLVISRPFLTDCLCSQTSQRSALARCRFRRGSLGASMASLALPPDPSYAPIQ